MTRLRNIFVVAAMATLFVGCGGSSTTTSDEEPMEDQGKTEMEDQGKSEMPPAVPPDDDEEDSDPPTVLGPPGGLDGDDEEEEEEEEASRNQVTEREARKALVGLDPTEALSRTPGSGTPGIRRTGSESDPGPPRESRRKRP